MDFLRRDEVLARDPARGSALEFVPQEEFLGLGRCETGLCDPYSRRCSGQSRTALPSVRLLPALPLELRLFEEVGRRVAGDIQYIPGQIERHGLERGSRRLRLLLWLPGTQAPLRCPLQHQWGSQGGSTLGGVRFSLPGAEWCLPAQKQTAGGRHSCRESKQNNKTRFSTYFNVTESSYLVNSGDRSSTVRARGCGPRDGGSILLGHPKYL